MALTTIRDEVLRDLKNLNPEAFVETHIFDRVPHFWGSDKTKFSSWKRQLARGLGVDPADITVVGSAAVGVSLNPYKNFKVFNSESDIDVAVISPFYFQSAWRFLRQGGAIRSKLTLRERGSWDDHKTNLVYWGAIATDRLLPRFPFGAEWRRVLDEIDSKSGSNSINVRVYNDYDALRSYQINSVKNMQRDIITKSG
ncbi:MAG: hypothetical protein WC729_00610 [Sphingomonas sp.]|jgi:hypothetical protein|uniref:hypothetical protein n=1 Tax=Sphingomonas sp. TaxID=28214 RepID=UPI003566E743